MNATATTLLARLGMLDPVREIREIDKQIQQHALETMEANIALFDRAKLFITRQELTQKWAAKQDKRVLADLLEVQQRLLVCDETQALISSAVQQIRVAKIAASMGLVRAALDALAAGVKEEIDRVQAADAEKAATTGFDEISVNTLAFLDQQAKRIEQGKSQLSYAPESAFITVLQIAAASPPKPRKVYADAISPGRDDAESYYPRNGQPQSAPRERTGVGV